MGPTSLSPADRVALLIKELEITTYQFGKETGISHQTLSNVLTGKNKPGLDTLQAIAAVYPAAAVFLLTGMGQPFPDGRYSQRAAPAPTPLPTLTLAEEPAAAYGCIAPDMVATLTAEVTELRAENKSLQAEVKQARREAREDLVTQARLYNYVKVSQEATIARLYAKLDEYELRLGYRQPTQEEAARMQAESPRPVIGGFKGQRYAELLDEVVAEIAAEAVEAKHFYLQVA